MPNECPPNNKVPRPDNNDYRSHRDTKRHQQLEWIVPVVPFEYRDKENEILSRDDARLAARGEKYDPVDYATVYANNAERNLSSEDRELLSHYLNSVEAFWRENGIHVKSIRIDYYIDPNENYRQVVVQHDVDEDMDAALIYWESLNEYISMNLLKALSADNANKVLDSISTDVRWKD